MNKNEVKNEVKNGMIIVKRKWSRKHYLNEWRLSWARR
jgi:hypothetical protein